MQQPKNWVLKTDKGRQTWELSAKKQSFTDKYWLGTLKDNTILPTPKNPYEAAVNGLSFYEQLVSKEGHFAGEYGGPMFLIPGLCITMHITKTPYPEGFKQEIKRYLRNRANPVDGGWGIHIEGKSTVFGTALNYVALRLLGLAPDDPSCLKARSTLWALGGATGIPAWGKFWLSILNVYDWRGNNPIPPELWLLPYSLPIHPGKMWCHTRAVYLPMGYLYGKRFSAPVDDLILSLREELYPEPYESIYWPAQRNNVASVDLYSPTSGILNFLNKVLDIYELLPISPVRNIAMREALKQVRMEDENTKFLDIGPVNKKHVDRIPDFMWMSKEGMMMNGTNGSQLWDTAFAVQAILAGDLYKETRFKGLLRKNLEFLDLCQITDNVPNYKNCHRHISKGAWPFSTKDQGYTVSDCTAEGLKSVLLLQSEVFPETPLINDSRLFDSINVLLSMQNSDGGFASYELQRAPEWLEMLNPAQVFGKIMVEYSYPECTTAVLLSLSTFKKLYPSHRIDEIETVTNRAVDYIRKSQRQDGSWFGSWGICFTYAMFFAIESLVSVGETFNNSDTLKRACDFLISKQMDDGGWGESYKSCESGAYVNHQTSQVVQTAWAVIALMSAQYPHKELIKKGIDLIMSRQKVNGEWAQEGIEGVFNKNCMISYPNYKFAFPIWALNKYAKYYQ